MKPRVDCLVGLLVLAIVVSSFGCATPVVDRSGGDRFDRDAVPLPQIDFAPRHYVCRRAVGPVEIDGRLDDASWQKAAQTEEFVDIEGDLKPAPTWSTRARMLWDDEYFYVGARLEEPHVWGKLTERDSVIFYDNDFEVFIDPDGDTHAYYELEVNALNTQWDLFLVQPYRDGGPAMNAWDIQGLKTAVHVEGTLNDPSDVDTAWSVEIAIPWAVLKEAAGCTTPPEDGDQWRVGFSRVEWQVEAVDGRYEKKVDPATGKHYPENNWIWSAQGLINMHYPELWGIVQFSTSDVGGDDVEYVPDPELEPSWLLRRLYYAQRSFHAANGRFFAGFSECPGWSELRDEFNARYGEPEIRCTDSGFEATLEFKGNALHIDEVGRLWRTPTSNDVAP